MSSLRRSRRLQQATTQVMSSSESPLPSTSTSFDSQSPTRTSLRKGATFHSPITPPAESDDPILHVPSLPRRSPTCPRELDAIVANQTRIAAVMEFYQKPISDHCSDSTAAHRKPLEEDLPLPRGLLRPSTPSSMTGTTCDIADRNRQSCSTGAEGKAPVQARLDQSYKRHHTSDSGIGSTVSGSIRTASSNKSKRDSVLSSAHWQQSLPSRPSMRSRQTSSVLASGLPVSSLNSRPLQPALSLHATQQIQRRVLQPILRSPSLKDFHPLIRDIPRRVIEKEILCLRDLEKTLVYLAPGGASSSKSYLSFAEFSIQCIHTTVNHLSPRDQCQPADRPYTNNYFVDLVAQVRQYATEMATARERRAAGEAQPRNESEKVMLDGGLSQTGRPARLVRVKEGKTMPISTGDNNDDCKAIKGSNSPIMKRSLSERADEGSVRRSMARRRKLAPGEVLTEPAPQVCQDCDKEFKRPCDLTKHEKTHSRPFKCDVESCKYYSRGWPTEKERDRHVNDKHSQAPPMYTCLFEGCAYKSKRESNCKQHMEKKHNWNYVRAKGNGHKGSTSTVLATPQTPVLNTPSSYAIETPSISTDQSASPLSHWDAPQLHHDPSGHAGFFEAHGPYEEEGDMYDGPALPRHGIPYSTLNASGASVAQEEPDLLNDAGAFGQFGHQSMPPSVSFLGSEEETVPLDVSYPQLAMPGTPGAMASIPDWGRVNTFAGHNAQLMTPHQSVEWSHRRSFSEASDNALLPTTTNHMHQLSPNAQNLMLYSPHSAEDEGFDDFMPAAGAPLPDFSLFPPINPAVSGAASNGLFEDFPSQVTQTGLEPYYRDIPSQSQGIPFDDYLMDVDPES
ncbi:MAG: copper-binding transcription factor [Caeruleum heppii]|nr:MAG: copper-binding transcription factor [Caeruleum heppii]